MIPTINSARYLDIILAFYREHDIAVEVLVDTKSADRTKEVAATFYCVRDLINPELYIEPAIEKFSLEADTTWVLRIDDDELPTLEMMRFVSSALASPDFESIDVVGFPRHQCLVTRDGRLLECTAHCAATAHRQWRLYRPDRIAFHSHVHTPGFGLGGIRPFEAPNEACLIHLDWSVHTRTERQDKMDRYERIAPRHLANVEDYYLFETAPNVAESLDLFDRPEFATVVRRLTERGLTASLDLAVPDFAGGAS